MQSFYLVSPEYSEDDIEQYGKRQAYNKHSNYRNKKSKAIPAEYYISRQAAQKWNFAP